MANAKRLRFKIQSWEGEAQAGTGKRKRKGKEKVEGVVESHFISPWAHGKGGRK